MTDSYIYYMDDITALRVLVEQQSKDILSYTVNETSSCSEECTVEIRGTVADFWRYLQLSLEIGEVPVLKSCLTYSVTRHVRCRVQVEDQIWEDSHGI